MKPRKHRDLRSKIKYGRCPYQTKIYRSNAKLGLLSKEPEDTHDHFRGEA